MISNFNGFGMKLFKEGASRLTQGSFVSLVCHQLHWCSGVYQKLIKKACHLADNSWLTQLGFSMPEVCRKQAFQLFRVCVKSSERGLVKKV
jgi:hypothetical protein